VTAKKFGMAVRANLLIGFPHETRAQIFSTVRYGVALAWKGIDDVGISLFAPYPGSEIFNDLQKRGRIVLDDAYFFNLNSRWSANELHVNECVGPRELAVYRLTFMLLNYIVGYARYPRRVIRTVRNVFFKREAATNFEHFLNNAFRRWAPWQRTRQEADARYSADAA
jgi:anaerobic magnesium-protoporphyrin IX monomethyl ester cyclase